MHINYLKEAKTNDQAPDWMTEDLPSQEELEPLGIEEVAAPTNSVPDRPQPELRVPSHEDPILDLPRQILQAPEPDDDSQVQGRDLPLGEDGLKDLLDPDRTVTTTRYGRRVKRPDRFTYRITYLLE